MGITASRRSSKATPAPRAQQRRRPPADPDVTAHGAAPAPTSPPRAPRWHPPSIPTATDGAGGVPALPPEIVEALIDLLAQALVEDLHEPSPVTTSDAARP